ncbi:hypothetical protein [Saccharopolyspora sp. 6M]|uniref:hypothetical protein n=1 Tax=Saccharopolyspora sp. 6M TaxID=2877237 RepID=UPI001CD5876D|nr:hypothetical protein [Saccharopolyspora sp. 6M]MCA1228120.1 hypothetical protein [Saccharopolyspora sp. 6M]
MISDELIADVVTDGDLDYIDITAIGQLLVLATVAAPEGLRAQRRSPSTWPAGDFSRSAPQTRNSACGTSPPKPRPPASIPKPPPSFSARH